MIAPNRPRNVFSVWLGPWSWYGQTPTESGVHSHWYVNVSPGRDEPARARELAHVRAVVLGVVLDAVRMHRDRLAQPAVGVAEVHDEHVADLGEERRPRDLQHVLGRREPRRHLLVAVGAVGVALRELAVVPLVALVRRDLPVHGVRPGSSTRGGGRPARAGSAARPAAARRCGAARTRAAAASALPSDRGPLTSTSSPPIVHSSAVPPARPKKERRVVERSSAMTAAQCSTCVPGLQVRSYWLRCARVRRHRLACRSLRAGPRGDRRRDGPRRRARGRRRGHPSARRRRGGRLAVLDHLALRHEGRHPRGRAALDRAARGGAHHARSPIGSAAPTSIPPRGPRSSPTGCSSRSPASATWRWRCTGCRSSCSAAPARARCTASGGAGLLALGDRVLEHSSTLTPELDIRLVRRRARRPAPERAERGRGGHRRGCAPPCTGSCARCWAERTFRGMGGRPSGSPPSARAAARSSRPGRWARPTSTADPALGDPGWMFAAAEATCPHCGCTSCCSSLAAEREAWRVDH